jgi:hypothetical protein
VATAAFFYEYDLFQHPSLQEKLVLLFGAALVRLAWGPLVRNRAVHLFLFAVVFALGVGSKASFMIYVSMSLWVFFSRKRNALFERREARAWIEVGAFGAVAFVALSFFAVVSARGTYTHQFDLAKVPGNVLSPAGALFLVPVALFVFWVARNPREFLRHPERLTALWGVLAFLAIFLPWGIQAYVQSVIGPVYGCLCLQLAFGLFAGVPARLWQIPLAVLALATAAYRVPTMFLRLHDIGRAVAASPSWEKEGITGIYMPCMEGAESMQQYLHEFAHSSIRVVRLEDDSHMEGKAVFYDLALCPLPGRARRILRCDSQEELFTGSLGKSFRLARGRGCR